MSSLISNLPRSYLPRRVGPLWQHLLPPAAPTLSFIGLPWKVVPFPLFELQARYHARVLSGRATPPPKRKMEVP